MNIIIEPHYFGSLEYYGLLTSCDEITLEIHQHFTKQTYKNRCHVLTANGVKPLSVPVKYDNRTALKDVKIDHEQSWIRDHWGAFYSSYGKAPFFEYFADGFREIWQKKHNFLLDLNMEMMTMCLDILQFDRSFRFSESYQIEMKTGVFDYREHISPKKEFDVRDLYRPVAYHQAFGNKFVENLSIVDLIMSEGTNALSILRQSHLTRNEQN